MEFDIVGECPEPSIGSKVADADGKIWTLERFGLGDKGWGRPSPDDPNKIITVQWWELKRPLRLVINKMDNDDPINHPSHYTAYKGLEIIDLTEQMNFNRGNAVKYIARAGKKKGANEVEDLQKARWYIDREIKRISNGD